MTFPNGLAPNAQNDTDLSLLQKITQLLYNLAASGGGLPDQAGHAGQYLTTDGSNASWSAVAPGSGTTWSSGTGAPAGGSGNVGDWYGNTDNQYIYQKTGGATWTLRFVGAKAVSDTEVTFTTPTQGDLSATLGA
jgi:hypothetical protein